MCPTPAHNLFCCNELMHTLAHAVRDATQSLYSVVMHVLPASLGSHRYSRRLVDHRGLARWPSRSMFEHGTARNPETWSQP
jgi:hypothetical protein